MELAQHDNGVIPPLQKNHEERDGWWGVPGRMLPYV
jgi:hypothetical protein